MSTQEIAPTNKLRTLSITSRKDQCALWQMLGIWMVGGAPTWLLGWVPFLALRAGLLLAEAGLLRMKLLTVGLVWQFVLAMIILYREEGNIRIRTIRLRFPSP